MSDFESERRLSIPDHVPPDQPLDGTPDYDVFEKTGVVGTGGNATVYAATIRDDPNHDLVLKEPHVPEDASKTIRDRFQTEAETWAALDDHVNIVSVYAWDTDPHPWIALEYMDAGDLTERVDDCSLPKGLWIGIQVAAAVDHAHRNGVVHLDLKPENVLFRESSDDAWGLPKIADWGMAAFLQEATVNLEGLSPRYAAPEQFSPGQYGQPGIPTDIYQLGVVLYELVVGSLPFDGPPRALRDAILEEAPPAPSGRNPDLPGSVDDVLDRALAKAPANRYGSMDTFRNELEQLLESLTEYEPAAKPANKPESSGRDEDGEPRTQRIGAANSDVSGETSPYDRVLTLAEEGFVQLSDRYFARRTPAPPLEAWRRGVTLIDAHAGRVVERTVPDESGDGSDRTRLRDRLIDGLAAKTDHVVLGPPGSGKSTVCKRVACEWFDRGFGPVFYRESGQRNRFSRPDALARRVTNGEGHALVIVEDAVRSEANAVFELIDRVADTDDVTVLLDARAAEWRDAGGRADTFGTDPLTKHRETLEPVFVPRPDTHELEQFVRAVEATTDRPLDIDVEELRGEVKRAAASESDATETQPGELFYLLHRLTALARDPLASDEAPTTLTDTVRDVYDRLVELGEEALDVGICVNVLNAAGIGVHPELLYAAAPGDSLTVEEVIDVLDGRVVFRREADWTDGLTAYPTIHEAWSTEFLAHCLRDAGDRAASDRFGRVVSRVLALADNVVARERIAETVPGKTPYLGHIETDPEKWADTTAEAIYALGRERPKLAPLFGDGKRDSITLPRSCSEQVVEWRPVWLGRMFSESGHFDRAERAFERLPRDDSDLGIERLLGLGHIDAERSEYEAAAESVRQCLSLVADSDRPSARARAEFELGQLLTYRSDYEDAREHLKKALNGFDAIDDRRRKAKTLLKLGEASQGVSDYDVAHEYFLRSHEIAREIGDLPNEGRSLNHLGLVAKDRGDFEAAHEHFKRCYEINRQLGIRNGEVVALGHLGLTARAQGEYDAAYRYQERALELYGELDDRHGQAKCYGNLGLVAKEQGDLQTAREYFERSLEMVRQAGDRHDEAKILSNIGEVAAQQGEYEAARDYLERSLEFRREIENRRGEAISLAALGVAARNVERYEEARDYFEQSLELFRAVSDRKGEAETLHDFGVLANEQGNRDEARKHFEEAADIYEEAGKLPGVLESLRLLVDRCAEGVDEPRVRSWCRRAEKLLSDAPDAQRDQHGEWVREQCSKFTDQ